MLNDSFGGGFQADSGNSNENVFNGSFTGEEQCEEGEGLEWVKLLDFEDMNSKLDCFFQGLKVEEKPDIGTVKEQRDFIVAERVKLEFKSKIAKFVGIFNRKLCQETSRGFFSILKESSGGTGWVENNLVIGVIGGRMRKQMRILINKIKNRSKNELAVAFYELQSLPKRPTFTTKQLCLEGEYDELRSIIKKNTILRKQIAKVREQTFAREKKRGTMEKKVRVMTQEITKWLELEGEEQSRQDKSLDILMIKKEIVELEKDNTKIKESLKCKKKDSENFMVKVQKLLEVETKRGTRDTKIQEIKTNFTKKMKKADPGYNFLEIYSDR